MLFHTGDVVWKWRDQKKWTQAKLATHAHVSEDVISNVEAGGSTSTANMERIVQALEHTMKELHDAVDASGKLTDEELKLVEGYRDLAKAPELQDAFRAAVERFQEALARLALKS